MKWNKPVEITEQDKNRSPVEWKRMLKRNVTGAAVAAMFITSAVWILIIAFAMLAA
jgi:hypothetical protein